MAAGISQNRNLPAFSVLIKILYIINKWQLFSIRFVSLQEMSLESIAFAVNANFVRELFDFFWWCHDMETRPLLLAFCRDNPLLTQRAVMRIKIWSFISYNKLLNKWSSS